MRAPCSGTQARALLPIYSRGTRGSPVAASHALAMPAQTFRASGQSFTSCVTVCFPRDARPPPLEAPGAEGLLSLALLCALPVPVVYCGPQVVALSLGNRRRGRCRARASIAVLSPLFCARRARARASQCRCACYAYFVLTYGNSVCGRIRHRMSAGGARTPRTRVFFASVVGNVSVIGNRISRVRVGPRLVCSKTGQNGQSSITRPRGSRRRRALGV